MSYGDLYSVLPELSNDVSMVRICIQQLFIALGFIHSCIVIHTSEGSLDLN